MGIQEFARNPLFVEFYQELLDNKLLFLPLHHDALCVGVLTTESAVRLGVSAITFEIAWPFMMMPAPVMPRPNTPLVFRLQLIQRDLRIPEGGESKILLPDTTSVTEAVQMANKVDKDVTGANTLILVAEYPDAALALKITAFLQNLMDKKQERMAAAAAEQAQGNSPETSN